MANIRSLFSLCSFASNNVTVTISYYVADNITSVTASVTTKP